ncbi:GNAT family N-acetyltransferase [Mesobacillus zeae]|uniref:GNAT family N-acetyltransferase n=1 Tax=Mesobacillus zeae TaxID=1917180 RepID=UPI0015E6C232|nr:GNAT family protein [Mesobacillus zeae]
MDHIKLEALKDSHASSLYGVLKDDKIYTFIPEGPPESLEVLMQKFSRLAKGAPEHIPEVWLNYAIYSTELNQYIGTTQATISKDTRKATIAYILSPMHWGKGFAKQAVSLMMDSIISEYDVKEFDAYIDTRNSKSVSLVKGLGFDQINYIKNADFFKGHDSHEFVYSIKSEQWERQKDKFL